MGNSAEMLLTFRGCIDAPGRGNKVSLHSDKVEENTYIHFHLLPVGVLNSRIVAFYPYVLNELGGQAAFAHSPCPNVNPAIPDDGGEHIPAPKTTMWYSRLCNLSAVVLLTS
jgi:hypothetical protein